MKAFTNVFLEVFIEMHLFSHICPFVQKRKKDISSTVLENLFILKIPKNLLPNIFLFKCKCYNNIDICVISPFIFFDTNTTIIYRFQVLTRTLFAKLFIFVCILFLGFFYLYAFFKRFETK